MAMQKAARALPVRPTRYSRRCRATSRCVISLHIETSLEAGTSSVLTLGPCGSTCDVQCTLRCPGCQHPKFPACMQALVRPYLDSKFHIRSAQSLPKGVVFGSLRGSTFAKWMYNWPRQLTMYHATGETLSQACKYGPSIFHAAFACGMHVVILLQRHCPKEVQIWSTMLHALISVNRALCFGSLFSVYT